MWILVMFDLPTDSRESRKKATKFRQFLLDEGFVMSQYSNYLRFCKGKEQSEAYIRRIERNLPERGKINILMFTDKQYENIISFSGKTRNPAARNPGQLALF
ncbi:CRISPR-associated endonuclease Cas2 [Denitrobaculum tricleocarpae]|uniref:CRISPR-associated endoribonuclease Cas2 n=1 Tax=Denitrobaculum tricleocarpae TaxID=2591009 RepID=A0A545TP28_9PROT|nr:CRISPR-associated endonuclease Cas2 [Denitrobaculum tricleocarpae]TQV78977.1 CRISPR-associated endonuclease Cas2 [Denitrobaculum tricleocarpae]